MRCRRDSLSRRPRRVQSRRWRWKDVALQMNYAAPPEPPAVQLPVLHLSVEPSLSPVSMTNSTTISP